VARIAGVDLPKDKRTEIALTRIYGIGPTTAKKLCALAGIPDDSRVKNLTEEQVNKLRHGIEESYKVEGMLRSEISMNIKRLLEIGSYRGLRPPSRTACQRTEN